MDNLANVTVKGINTVNHDGEIIPCPYMDLSLGNVTKEPGGYIKKRNDEQMVGTI